MLSASGRAGAGQVLVPQLERLGDVKLIGLGGVGGVLARYGGLYLDSLDAESRLVLVDGDTFEPSNTSRMIYGLEGNKAQVVRQDLLRDLGAGSLSVEAIASYVTPDNVAELIHDGDIVLVAVDNHATRKLVSEFCSSQLRNVCLISGGNDGVGKDSTGRVLRGTAGNCQIYVRRDGVDLSPSLTAYHGEIRNPVDRIPEASCTEMAQLGVPQILLANMMVAVSMLDSLWLHLCDALHYEELIFDIAEGVMRPVRLKGEGEGVKSWHDTPPVNPRSRCD